MLVLQITDHEVRFLRGQWPGIMAYACQVRNPQGALADDIRLAAQQVKAAAESCVVVLSRRDVVLKEASFPSTDRQEILKMIDLKVSMIVPYDKDQTVYDYRLIGVADSGYSETLAAVTPEGKVQKYINAIGSIGLSISDIYLDIDPVDLFLKKCGFFSLIPQESFVCFLMDGRRSEIFFYRNDLLIYTSHVPYGIADCSANSREAADSFLRSIQAFETDHPAFRTQTIWLINDARELSDFMTLISGQRPWDVKPLGDVLAVPDGLRRLFDSRKMDVSWFPLLGCLLKEPQTRFMNFLPKGVTISNAKRRGFKDKAHFFAALAAVVVFTFFLGWSLLYYRSKDLEAVNQQIARLDPALERLRAESEFVALVSRRSDDRLTVVNMINELYAIIPEGVSIQFLSMRLKGGFELQGMTIDDQEVNRLQSALVASPLFSRVNLQYTTKRRRFDKEYTEFKIVFDPGI